MNNSLLDCVKKGCSNEILVQYKKQDDIINFCGACWEQFCPSYLHVCRYLKEDHIGNNNFPFINE
jgi:hypothetical protein